MENPYLKVQRLCQLAGISPQELAIASITHLINGPEEPSAIVIFDLDTCSLSGVAASDPAAVEGANLEALLLKLANNVAKDLQSEQLTKIALVKSEAIEMPIDKSKLN